MSDGMASKSIPPPLHWAHPEVPAEQALKQALIDHGAAPLGWRPVVKRMLQSLIAVRTIDRVPMMRSLSTQYGVGELLALTETTDPVIVGILRRCEARAGVSCRECGRQGRPRYVDDDCLVVLCPTCAALPLLVKAIADANELAAFAVSMNRGIAPVHAVPELLRPNFLQRRSQLDDSQTAPGGEPAMSRSHYLRWIDDLQQQRRRLPVPAHWG